MPGPGWLAPLFRPASGGAGQAPGEPRGYVICTTQRSGSNYLCELLDSTGVLGHPLDYFNAEGRRAKGWPDYSTDPGAQLEAILQHAPTANGVYGFKLFAGDVDRLAGLDWTARMPRLQWIYLRREDLLEKR